jgi:hypothetical protein
MCQKTPRVLSTSENARQCGKCLRGGYWQHHHPQDLSTGQVNPLAGTAGTKGADDGVGHAATPPGDVQTISFGGVGTSVDHVFQLIDQGPPGSISIDSGGAFYMGVGDILYRAEGVPAVVTLSRTAGRIASADGMRAAAL